MITGVLWFLETRKNILISFSFLAPFYVFDALLQLPHIVAPRCRMLTESFFCKLTFLQVRQSECECLLHKKCLQDRNRPGGIFCYWDFFPVTPERVHRYCIAPPYMKQLFVPWLWFGFAALGACCLLYLHKPPPTLRPLISGNRPSGMWPPHSGSRPGQLW